MTNRRESSNAERFGYSLKAARIRAGYGERREAAKHLGVSDPSLQRWESGEQLEFMPPFTLVKIAKVYDADYLIYNYQEISPVTAFFKHKIEAPQEMGLIHESFRDATLAALDDLRDAAGEEPDDPEELRAALAETDKVCDRLARIVNVFRYEFYQISKKI